MSTVEFPLAMFWGHLVNFPSWNFQQHTVELGHRRAVLCLVRSTHLFAAVEGKARQRFWSQMVEWDELMLLTVGLHFATQRQFPSCHLEDSGVYFEHKGVGGKSFWWSRLLHNLLQWSFWDWLPFARVPENTRGCAYGEKSPCDPFQFLQSQQGPCVGMLSTRESEVIEVPDTGWVSTRTLSAWWEWGCLARIRTKTEERWCNYNRWLDP